MMFEERVSILQGAIRCFKTSLQAFDMLTYPFIPRPAGLPNVLGSNPSPQAGYTGYLVDNPSLIALAYLGSIAGRNFWRLGEGRPTKEAVLPLAAYLNPRILVGDDVFDLCSSPFHYHIYLGVWG